MTNEIKIPENAFSQEIQARWRDVDGMKHVNHAVYLTYLETVRVNWILSQPEDNPIRKIPVIIARVEIDYKLPLLLGQNPTVSMWISKIGKKSFTFDYVITSQDHKVVYATAKTVMVHFDYETQVSTLITAELRPILEKMQITE